MAPEGGSSAGGAEGGAAAAAPGARRRSLLNPFAACMPEPSMPAVGGPGGGGAAEGVGRVPRREVRQAANSQVGGEGDAATFIAWCLKTMSSPTAHR